MSPAELDALIGQHADVRVLDVRTPGEFETAHIPGAYNIPLTDLGDALEELSGVSSRLVVVCQSGSRADAACSTLTAAGVDGVELLDGGMAAWHRSGGRVRRARHRWDLERQVRLVAGSLVLGSVLASIAKPAARPAGRRRRCRAGGRRRDQSLHYGDGAGQAADQPALPPVPRRGDHGTSPARRNDARLPEPQRGCRPRRLPSRVRPTMNIPHDNLVFQQYYLECLSQASYLIGDRGSGRAVVVDPRRDIAEYLADAAANGLTITHVVETHFHADFLSGHLELAAQTGAEIVYGAAAAGRVGFPIRAMADGERLELGAVSLEVRETPGHTPESICIVIWDRAGREPFGVLTGDTLFIGDVGRPDLLAAAGTSPDELGRQLYHSIHDKLLMLPDATKVFPAHGAGSACGKQLSTETVSTIGEQRRTNYALAPMTEDAFVDAVTEGQTAGAAVLLLRRQHQPPRAPSARRASGARPAPTRRRARPPGRRRRQSSTDVTAAAFAAGHLRGSINVGLDGRFAEYVGAIVHPGTPIVLVTEPGLEDEAKVRLARIGFDTVVGALESPDVAFATRPDVVERASRLTADELGERRRDVPGLQLIDVRNNGEVDDGMLDGARHIALPGLLDHLDELDPTMPTVVYCAGGYRSSIAASTLRAHGFSDVSDVIGGYGACRTAGRTKHAGVPTTAG